LLLNISKNAVIADRVIIADTFHKRLLGLMGKRELAKGYCLLLKPCNAIHTCFMRFPIDVLFLDKTGGVKYTIAGLKSFKRSPVVKEAYCVAELPAGSIEATGTEPGDLCVLKYD
jgi:hypothetical protein